MDRCPKENSGHSDDHKKKKKCKICRKKVEKCTCRVTIEIDGCRCEKGDTGPPGPKGDTGAPGQQGLAGQKGDTGAPGPKGDTGSSGQKGDTGQKGDRGAAGEKGDTGAPGPKGDTGEKGERGDTGHKGDRGDTGGVGPKGDTGEKGERGDTGHKGDRGDTGAAGPKGDTGPSGGPKGDTGAPGPKGDTGEKGDTGDKGDRGDTGAPGPKGDKGDTGAPGPKGDKGDTGDCCKCIELNSRSMWCDPCNCNTADTPLIPKSNAGMITLVGWPLTLNSDKVVTYTEVKTCSKDCSCAYSLTVKLHFVILNNANTSGNFLQIKFEAQSINQAQQFGTDLIGISKVETLSNIIQPAANTYRHYCLTSEIGKVAFYNCPSLLLRWSRVSTAAETVSQYNQPIYLVATTICYQCAPKRNCVGSIGYWKNQGVSSQVYPMYLGNAGGQFTIIVDQASAADKVLAKNQTSNNQLNNLLAQLLAAKFAFIGNCADLPDFVKNAATIADNYISTFNPSNTYAEPLVADPSNPSVSYGVSDVLEMYDNPSISQINSRSPSGQKFSRPASWPQECKN